LLEINITAETRSILSKNRLNARLLSSPYLMVDDRNFQGFREQKRFAKMPGSTINIRVFACYPRAFSSDKIILVIQSTAIHNNSL